jgi:hypothetical protein
MIKKSHKFGIILEKNDGDPKTPRAECNYYGKNYACHTIINGTSNM